MEDHVFNEKVRRDYREIMMSVEMTFFLLKEIELRLCLAIPIRQLIADKLFVSV